MTVVLIAIVAFVSGFYAGAYYVGRFLHVKKPDMCRDCEKEREHPIHRGPGSDAHMFR